MATPKTVVINCGASHVSAGVFTASDDRIRCEKIVHHDLDYDFSQEDRWLDATLRALREVVSRDKISGAARIILPGFLLLTKTFRIAHVEGSKQAQVIAYEAQQNIPYPLSEVNWDYQILTDDGVECEVLFIAIKADVARRFCNEVARLGLKPSRINASTILDCMALRYAFGEEQGDVLMANIGARATNLTFAHDDGFLVRNIALGGNSLTQTLADRTGKSFDEAEQLKMEAFAEEGTEKASDEIFETAKSAFLRRMNQEITRSIVNFRQQRKGSSPKKLFLSGRAALLPGLAEHLAQHQKLEIEFFEPGTHLELDPSIDPEAESIALFLATELLGDMAGVLNPNAVGVNLLPRDIQSEMEFRRKRPYLALAALLVAVAPLPFLTVFQEQQSILRDKQARISQDVGYHQSLSSDIRQVLEQIDRRRGQISALSGLVNSKHNWIQFFADLQESLFDVGDVWLDSLEIERATGPGQAMMEVKGRMLLREGDSDIVAEYGEVDPQLESLLSQRIQALSERFTDSEFFDPERRAGVRLNFENIREGSPLLLFTLELPISDEMTL